MRKRKKRFKFSKFWVFIPLLILIGLIFFFISSGFFTIKNITINLDQINCTNKDEIKSELNLSGKSILFLDEKKINSSFNKFECIKTINFEKKYPDEIILNLSGRKAVLSLAVIPKEASFSSVINQINTKLATPSSFASMSGILNYVNINFFLVDNQGEIFTTSTVPFLPLVYYEEELEGSALGQGYVSNILRILEGVKTLGLEVREAKIYSKNIFLVNAGIWILFSLDTPALEKLAALQLILEKAKIDEENMLMIDLRFDKPVVKIAPRNK